MTQNEVVLIRVGRRAGADAADQLVAVRARHADVADHHVEPLRLQHAERLGGGGRREHGGALLLELTPQYWAQTRARLDPRELDLPLGRLTVPVAAAKPAAAG